MASLGSHPPPVSHPNRVSSLSTPAWKIGCDFTAPRLPAGTRDPCSGRAECDASPEIKVRLLPDSFTADLVSLVVEVIASPSVLIPSKGRLPLWKAVEDALR